MKTQLGEETNMAEWRSPAMGFHAAWRRRTAPGDRETRVPVLETPAGANRQRLENHVWPWGDDKPWGKTALFLSRSIQLVLLGFRAKLQVTFQVHSEK